MAEAARRFQQAGGSDVVRRLLARPIRLEQRQPIPAAPSLPLDASVDEDWDEADADEASDDVARLETELTLTKAILQAERRELAALRARIEPAQEDDLSEEGRAVRQRWALLVDNLLRPAR
ncbi:hypothetical protein [Methylobacterium trifolii]|uniref:Uncharacterized protein n=1 Tax=Methylobacterium trifolii TaxID=1003092 RepID=A0ABQ4U039_9HYPH|nr:hypothetical protein [Methylobacterium trifolii]GJE60656.1 hypothetical protein MPOCJGCO_2770 [Methylobacterium trifolii]